MSGAGNDFIAVLDPSYLTPERVAILCARGHSLGADGMFSIEPLDPARAAAESAAVRMTYLNADGTPAGLCVNATRCAALLAFHLGWATERVELATGAGEIRAERGGASEVALELPPPRRGPTEQAVRVEGRRLQGWFVDTGVPHFVLEWDRNLVTAPVVEWGPRIRESPRFEDGANVDFVRFTAPGRLEIRTYERGVEGETLACGTGVLAAAAVAVSAGRGRLPVTALTSGGFELTVRGSATDGGRIDAWSLAGDARLIAEGEIASGALSVPEPPLWSD